MLVVKQLMYEWSFEDRNEHKFSFSYAAYCYLLVITYGTSIIYPCGLFALLHWLPA